MKGQLQSLEKLAECVGTQLGVSGWLTVEQHLIDSFGRSTLDMDWMHVEPARAAAEGPFGGPIAFGFWSLSLLTHFSHEISMWPDDVAYALNYGLERVRWVTPVLVGARIRMRCQLLELTDKGDGRFMIRTENVIEIEGEERPALVAEWLGLFIRAGAATVGTLDVRAEDRNA